LNRTRSGVLVTVWAQRLAEPVVVPGVLLRAGQPDAVRARLVLPAWSAGEHPAVFLPPGVDRAKRRRGQRDKDARVVRDGGGDALAAVDACNRVQQPGRPLLVQRA
jgi:hypothetical protein